MSPKTFVWIFLTIGSIVGGYIPVLWGSSIFSISSLLFSGVGGLLGIWVGYKISRLING